MDTDLDALGLIAARSRSAVYFGPVDVGVALVRANMRSRMNTVPKARLVVDLERAPGAIDYFAGLAVVAQYGDKRIPRFTGSVVEAIPVEDGVEIEALSAVAFAEGLISGMAARAIPRHELVYVLARSAGFREERSHAGLRMHDGPLTAWLRGLVLRRLGQDWATVDPAFPGCRPGQAPDDEGVLGRPGTPPIGFLASPGGKENVEGDARRCGRRARRQFRCIKPGVKKLPVGDPPSLG